MLNMLANKGKVDPAELIANMENVDPNTLLLLQNLIKQREQVSEEDDIDKEVYLEEGGLEEQQTQDKDTKHLVQLAREMYRELSGLRRRNDELADALGACYLCWGEDKSCSECHGRGQPGFAAPDREMFQYYVKPVIIRLKKLHNKEVRQDRQELQQQNRSGDYLQGN